MLTTREVAERLGAGESSIRIWLAEDPPRFPNAKRFGHVWMIPESDLDGFEKRGPGRPPNPTPANSAKPKAAKKASAKKKRK